MAIDSAEKRKSVAGIPFHLFLGVTPNAGQDVEWRQQAGWGYSGIAPSGAVATAFYWRRIRGNHPLGMDDYMISYQG